MNRKIKVYLIVFSYFVFGSVFGLDPLYEHSRVIEAGLGQPVLFRHASLMRFKMIADAGERDEIKYPDGGISWDPNRNVYDEKIKIDGCPNTALPEDVIFTYQASPENLPDEAFVTIIDGYIHECSPDIATMLERGVGHNLNNNTNKFEYILSDANIYIEPPTDVAAVNEPVKLEALAAPSDGSSHEDNELINVFWSSGGEGVISATEGGGAADLSIAVSNIWFSAQEIGNYNIAASLSEGFESSDVSASIDIVIDIDIDADGDGDIDVDDDLIEMSSGSIVFVGNSDLEPIDLHVLDGVSEGEVKLEVEDENEIIKIWKDSEREAELEDDSWRIGYDEVPSQIFVEGLKISENSNDVVISLRYTNGSDQTATDSVSLTCYGVDLDIDTDNNGVIDYSDTEDEYEDVDGNPLYPGKLVLVNNSDVDDDGVPNFADGIDSYDNIGVGAGGVFTPITLNVPEPIDLNVAKVKFNYLGSDPKAVPDGDLIQTNIVSGSITNAFYSATGHLRIWKNDGSASRSAREVDDSGDYVKNGSEYLIRYLFRSGAMLEREIPLFVEGVNSSTGIADQKIEVLVDPDGPGPLGYIVRDKVNLTVVDANISEIKGLYKNDGSYLEGYVSNDNEGRIYSNRTYDSIDPVQLEWNKNRQYIDIKVDVSPAGVPLPAEARIVWEVSDPDDYSDGGMDAVSSKAVDPNDYDNIDGDGDGHDQDGNDNTGGRDGYAKWEQLHADYLLTGNVSKIKNGVSKVRFNATDDGGDNYIVKAKIRLAEDLIPGSCDETGIMTVWKKIDGEYRKMIAAKTLPVDQVQPHYDKAFVEWVFHDKGASANHEFIHPSPGYSAYCQKNGIGPGQFHHRGDGGWHFVVAARKFHPSYDANPYGSQQNGTGDVLSNFVLEDSSATFTPGQYSAGKILRVTSADGDVFSFLINNNTDKQITIKPFEYTRPNGDEIRTLHLKSPELDLGTPLSYEIREGGVTGICPDLDANVLVFRETIEFIHANNLESPALNTMLLRTLVHELMHSFILHHNCGNADFEGTKSCVGSWSFAPVFDPDGNYEVKPASTNLCGEHLKAIREADGFGGE